MMTQAAVLATIGKSEEQLAAEKASKELKAKQERWAAGVARSKALKAPFHCEAQVRSGSSMFRTHDCGIKANFHRESRLETWDKESPMIVRHFCKRHDPVTTQERMDAKHAEEKREREAKWAAQDRAQVRSALMAKAVGHLTNEQLVALDTFLQTSLLTAEFRKVVR